MQREKIYIYGKHALKEALAYRPKTVRKVYLSPTLKEKAITDLLAKNSVPVALFKGNDVAKNVGTDAAHQGVIAVIDTSTLLTSFGDFMTTLEITSDTALILLNELEDPHNVGAIIRAGAAFGVSGILMPEHNQAPITGAVVKTSAGMAFRIPLVSIGNTNHTLRLLKDQFFKIYGLSMEGSRDLSQEHFDTPSVFIVGNESKGIREKTLELCDSTLRIPMHPRCESLNAAASAAVVLYEWSRGHRKALMSSD